MDIIATLCSHRPTWPLEVILIQLFLPHMGRTNVNKYHRPLLEEIDAHRATKDHLYSKLLGVTTFSSISWLLFLQPYHILILLLHHLFPSRTN